jgi:hypothetical protein
MNQVVGGDANHGQTETPTTDKPGIPETGAYINMYLVVGGDTKYDKLK